MNSLKLEKWSTSWLSSRSQLNQIIVNYFFYPLSKRAHIDHWYPKSGDKDATHNKLTDLGKAI